VAEKKAFAACFNHVNLMVDAMLKGTYNIKVVLRDVKGRTGFRCECDAPADYYMQEIPEPKK
jgi:hypothetical protein